MNERKTKAFKMDLEEVEDSGQFIGYASTWDVDLGKDQIQKGAFARTISHRQDHPILWQHDPMQPIGAGMEAREDSKGLWVKGQLVLEVQRAREAHALMKSGALRGLSIGYETKQDTYDKETGIRTLKEIQLYEFSPVTFPMQPLAQITNIKSQFVEATRDVLDTIRDIKKDSKRLPESILILAKQTQEELCTLLDEHGEHVNSPNGNLAVSLDHQGLSSESCDDSDLIHSIQQLRENIRSSITRTS